MKFSNVVNILKANSSGLKNPMPKTMQLMIKLYQGFDWLEALNIVVNLKNLP